jgi:MFS family permease
LIIKKKRYLYLITLAYACATFGAGLLLPIYAFFVQKIGGGIVETSWAVALFSIVMGITILLIAKTKWSHVYRKECLLVGWFIWLLGLVLYSYISDLTMLFIAQILNGLGTALSSPAYDAEFSEQASDDLTGGWGIFEGVNSIFSGLAAIIGGYFTSRYGFGALFSIMIATSTFSFILILYYFYEQKGVALTLQRANERFEFSD